MNRPEVYERSVNVLLDAFNKGELAHGTPCGCAVGNLVLATNEVLWEVDDYIIEHHIKNHGSKPWRFDWWQIMFYNSKCDLEAMKQIENTGYSVSEIKQIERAFEGKSYEDTLDNTQFYGLTAVLNKLAEIHEVDKVDAEVKQEKLETIYKKLQLA